VIFCILIKISDQIEQANAERMKYLIELADLKQVSLEALMDSLGINAGKNSHLAGQLYTN
jgi:hypothetical protein